MKNQPPQALLSFLASLRPKRFAEQNLGAGGIHFRRAREIRKGSRKIEDFVGKTRLLVASEQPPQAL